MLQHLGTHKYLQLHTATSWRVTSTHLSPQSLRKIASVCMTALPHEISISEPPRAVLPMATSTTKNNDISKRNGIFNNLQGRAILLGQTVGKMSWIVQEDGPNSKTALYSRRMQQLIFAIIDQAPAKQIMPASTGLHLGISIDWICCGGVVIIANLVRSARAWHQWKLDMWRISCRNRLSAGIANMRRRNQTILQAWRCCSLPG